MKLSTFVVLGVLLVASVGVAHAAGPKNGAYYQVDISPQGFCDVWEFQTFGPSNSLKGTVNYTTGIHDLNTLCGLGVTFPWGGFEVAFQTVQAPNDCGGLGSCENATDVQGDDSLEQEVEFSAGVAVTEVFDVTAKPTKGHTPSVAGYYSDGAFGEFVWLEGPIQIDAYTPSDGAKLKQNAAQHPGYGKPAVSAKR